MANNDYEPIGVPDNVPDAPAPPGGFRIPSADAPLIRASGEEINFEVDSGNVFSKEPLNVRRGSGEQPTQAKTPGNRTPGTKGRTPVTKTPVTKTPKTAKTPATTTPKNDRKSPKKSKSPMEEERRHHRERKREREKRRSRRRKRERREEEESEKKEKTYKKKNKNTGCFVAGFILSLFFFFACVGMDVVVLGHKWLGFSFIPAIAH